MQHGEMGRGVGLGELPEYGGDDHERRQDDQHSAQAIDHESDTESRRPVARHHLDGTMQEHIVHQAYGAEKEREGTGKADPGLQMFFRPHKCARQSRDQREHQRSNQ